MWKEIREIFDNGNIFWIVAGDFNNVLYKEERIGFFLNYFDYREFKECIDFCGFDYMKYIGCYFISNNK